MYTHTHTYTYVCGIVCVPSRSVFSNSLWSYELGTRLLHSWDSPGKNAGVGSHYLLQGSSQPRDRTLVSCITSRFFTVRATREANNTHKGGSVIKKKICLTMQEMWVRSLGQENPLEGEMATYSDILAGKSHRLKSLAGYSPCGHKESDTTEHKVHVHNVYYNVSWHVNLKC